MNGDLNVDVGGLSEAIRSRKEPSRGRRRSILFVQRDEQFFAALSRRLEIHHFNTIAVYEPAKVVDVACARRPDVIVVDFNLPHDESHAVCQALSDDSATAGIPVIAIGRGEGPEVIRTVRNYGCSFFVAQPCDPNALLVLIDHLTEFLLPKPKRQKARRIGV